MSHQSETDKQLKLRVREVAALNELQFVKTAPLVILLQFPPKRSDADGENSGNAFEAIAAACRELDEKSIVAVLTTPEDAARLLPYLQSVLHFQLWIAVKTQNSRYNVGEGRLPRKHSALLILSRCRNSLRHTLTRIAYTYCPACGKTTKDYGGKKHTYNPYGTLMSDVWRDIEVDVGQDTSAIYERLRDLFGLEPYNQVEVFDLRRCLELQPSTPAARAQEPATNLFGDAVRSIDSRLINGDCLTALRSLPDASVGFCFADPPYNLQKRYDKWDDAFRDPTIFPVV
jgi:site-specific DNA-methyltransferase (adenine-specific)